MLTIISIDLWYQFKLYWIVLCIHINNILCFSPRFELPAYQQHDANQKDSKKLVVICHFCGDTGHKAMYCHKMVSDLVKIKPELESNEQLQVNTQAGFPRKLKPLEEVTCYKVIL